MRIDFTRIDLVGVDFVRIDLVAPNQLCIGRKGQSLLPGSAHAHNSYF